MKYININNKLYDVDKIITRKIIKGKKFYLIKWKGYPLEYCSWEPLSHLTNILQAIKIFDENFPLSIERKQYKQYKKLYHNYQRQKLLNKKQSYENNEIRNTESNKIIIDLDSLIIAERKNDETNKNDETSTIQKTKIEIKINKEEEKESKKEESNILKNECNINSGNELIKPILIW